jgi:hypothetical protein
MNRDLRQAEKKMGRLKGAQKMLSALALAQELKRCYDECEKNPCAH